MDMRRHRSVDDETASRSRARRFVVLLTVPLVAGCSVVGGDEPADEPATATSGNPAADYCVEQGGATFGPEPMCGLPDGTTVDAWEFYRLGTTGETSPAAEPTSTASSADPRADLDSVAKKINASDVSAISEGPCESHAVLIVDGVLQFRSWDGADWTDASDRLGPPIDDPIGITSSDLTGDGVIDFLVEFDSARSSTGRTGGVFTSGSDCNWAWASFSSDEDDVLADPPFPVLLDGLRLDGERLAATHDQYRSGRTNALVDFDAGRDLFLVRWPTDLNPAPTTTAATVRPVTSCGGSYRYDDSLPISVCSQGFSVELFQMAIGQVDADGYFGPGTHAALIDVQRRLGVPVTGVLDAATWRALGVTANAPYPDLNGDGVVDGSEFPAG